VSLVVYGTMPVYAGSYNRSAAVSYADQWAHGRNSYYSNYTLDCTNFVSQILWAGGLPRIPTCNASACQTDNASDSRQWWFVPVSRVNSKTWSATDWMNQHFSQYQGSRFQIKASATNLRRGDVLLMQLPDTSKPSHARIIVGTGNSQECAQCGIYPLGTFGLLASQHSTDRMRVIWSDNIPAGTPLWPWKIIW